jgi:predicted transcriptional regulator
MVGDLGMRPVVTIDALAPVRDAARLMRQHNVGSVVVVKNHRPRGIITDRDIAVSVVAEGLDAADVPVADVMRANPAVIRCDQGVLDAVEVFATKGVRRLPVVDNRGFVVGIITLDDVLMRVGTEMAHIATALARSVGRPKAA